MCAPGLEVHRIFGGRSGKTNIIISAGRWITVHGTYQERILDGAYSNVPNDKTSHLIKNTIQRKNILMSANWNKPSGLTKSQTHTKIEQ